MCTQVSTLPRGGDQIYGRSCVSLDQDRLDTGARREGGMVAGPPHGTHPAVRSGPHLGWVGPAGRGQEKKL